MIRIPVLVLALVSLASCGGDSSSQEDDYQAALAQTDAAQTQAESLAVTTPCNAVQQCAIMTLTVPSGHCAVPSYRPYSLVSPTADAASAAAANERTLAEHAISLSPPTACTDGIQVPPVAACSANACQAVQPN